MKMINKIKYCLIMFGTTLMMLPYKIFAVSNNVPEMTSLYAAPKEEVTKNDFNFVDMFFKILSYVIVPLVVLIGAIVFYKKSKLKKSTKILIIAIIFILLAVFLGYMIIEQGF